jgi:hypothetical protein
VAGLSAYQLEKDSDFVRAVRAIVQKCRVNVDVATVYCWPGEVAYLHQVELGAQRGALMGVSGQCQGE